MHELRDVAEVRRLLVEADAVARFFDDETRLAEGVYVAVDRAARHLEPFGQLVDVVGGVRREQLHQPQQAFAFGLIHAVVACFSGCARGGLPECSGCFAGGGFARLPRPQIYKKKP